MNRFTRLTALLLALMMILSTFAAAETAYQVGDMTTEQWNSIVQNAQSILNEPVINKGGDVIDYPPETPTPSTPYDKTIEVTLGQNQDITTANLAVVKSNVADQWQIAIKDDLWVNILGEAGSTLNVNAGMLRGTTMKVRQAGNDAQVTAFTLSEATAAVQTFAVENRADSTTTTPSAANDAMTIEDANTVIIEVAYQYPNGDVVASSHTAQIAKGTDYATAQPLPLPEVKGYLATTVAVEPANTDASTYTLVPQTLVTTTGADNIGDITDGTIALNLHNISNAVKYTVKYEPSYTEYTVKHYQQNLENDEYTLVGTDKITVAEEMGTKRRKTGDSVGTGLANTYEGFTQMWYNSNLTVAADGSTVVEIYYDRNYYLVMFNLDGGMGVQPVYGKFGSSVGAIGVPDKAGYAFSHWVETDANWNVLNNGAQATLPTTIDKAQHRYFKAVYKEADTTFRVTYWLENPNWDGVNPDNEYLYWGSKEVAATTGDEVNATTYESYADIAADLDTYEKRYSTYNAEKTAEAGDVTVAGDGSTVLNVYYDRNEYTLKFYYAMYESNRWSVVGGSTYYFGTLEKLNTTEEDDAIALMQQYFTSNYTENYKYVIRNQRGNVAEEPTLNALGQARVDSGAYTIGYDTANNRRYYYVSFKAKYGQDLNELWPSDVFNSVTAQNWSENNWTGSEAFVSAWNGEHHVYYTQHNSANQTIKGKYAQLDYQVLWDYDKFDDSPEVDYLCFWENGANIGWSVPELYRYNIYVELLEGEDATGLKTRTYNGKTYYEREVYNTVDDSDVNNQTAPAITGLTNVWYNDAEIENFDTSLYTEAWDMFFYYDRNMYTLAFSNVGKKVSSVERAFEQDISDLSTYVPANPEDVYPTGAYVFGGWYTSPECQDEAKYTFDTMPANDVILYAKWNPVEFTVSFYLTEEVMRDNQVYFPVDAKEDASWDNIAYNTTVAKEYVEAHLDADSMAGKNGELAFVGWFYKDDNGNEQPFEPTMAITQNMQLYGKWSSNVGVPYTFYFKAVVDGVETEIADAVSGYALHGQTATQEAKTGNSLKPAYQTGWYPNVASHSLTVDINDASANEFIFWYTQGGTFDVLVQYLEVDENGNTTGVALSPEKKYTTSDAVVTENYVPVSGYMVKHTQIRLILSTEGPNVIQFLYQKDTTHAYYTVTHYITPAWSKTPIKYQETSIETGDIGKEYTKNELVIDGYKLNEIKVLDSATKNLIADATISVETGTAAAKLPETGMDFEFYYVPIEYPFEVRYLEQGTNNQLGASRPGESAYGSTVKADAYSKEFTGYELVSTIPSELTIQIEPDTNNDGDFEVTNNIITFYYKKIEVTIDYRIVAPDGSINDAKADCGDLTLYKEPGTSGIVTALDGPVVGSTAKANPNYTFVGWYSDRSCEETYKISDVATIKPQPVDHDTDAETAALYQTATYYAKFIENEVKISYVAALRTNGTVAYPSGIGGLVDLNGDSETAAVFVFENIKILTGDAAGATAFPNTNYKFVGWFADASCSGTAISTNVNYQPGKNSSGVNTEATYYALFELDVADLTIIKKVNNAKDGTVAPTGDVFTFRVELPDGEYTYTVDGKESGSKLDVQDGKGELSIKAGEVVAIKDVVINSHYKVSEVKKHDYFEASNSVEGQITATGSTAEITNTYLTGNLVITKVVDPATGAPDDTFTMNVMLTLPTTSGATLALPTTYKVGDNTYNLVDGVVKLKNGQSATIAGLPYGTKYTVTEDNMTYYTGTVNPSGEQTIEHASQEVKVTNAYQSGNLQITKAVTSNPAGVTPPTGDTFTIVVTLTKPEGSKVDWTKDIQYSHAPSSITDNTVTFNGVKAGDANQITISNLPVGTGYSIQEDTVLGYYSNTVGYKYSNEQKKILGTGVETVEVTNTYLTNNLEITKTVTPEKSAPITDEFDLSVKLEWPVTAGATFVFPTSYTVSGEDSARPINFANDGTATITLQANQTATFANLPVGTKYTVAETKYPAYYTPPTAPVSGSIDANGTANVTITNTYNTVDLKITKKVTTDEGITAPDDTFEITVTLELPNGLTELPASVNCKLNENAVTATGTSVVFTGVKANDVMQISGLPAGTKYIATETKHPSYYEVSGEVASATAITDATKDITITNKYLTGSLEITKDVVGEGMPIGETFIVNVNLTLPNGSSGTALPLSLISNTNIVGSGAGESTTGGFKFTGIADNSKITISGIPYGTTYSVTEEPPAAYYTAGYTYDDSTEKKIGNETADKVTVTNTYITGSLDVTKEVVGVTAPRGEDGKGTDEFSFTLKLTDKDDPNKLINATINCNRDINGNGSGIYTFTLKDGETAQFTQLPANVQYTVTETAHRDYTTTQTGDTGVIAADSATATHTAEVKFTNAYKYGDLIITKRATGANAASSTFIFKVEGESFNGYVSITGSDSVTLKDLKPGSYRVIEQTNWSYRFNADETSATVTVVAGETKSVNFTNTEKTDKWLHDESVEHNVFSTTTNTTEGGEQ